MKIQIINWGSFLGITACIAFVLSLFPNESLAQVENYGQSVRNNLPRIVVPKTVSPPPGYCESYGGSTTFESISSVSVVEKQGNLLDITINVFIANPTGCVSGEPCPAYDDYPENVNVWIDWDGDQTWESHEKVLDIALTGYNNINYEGTMTTRVIVAIPPTAVRPTWLRANLGWGSDPEDPCQKSWAWGNVVDQRVLWNLRVKEITATLNINLPEFPKPLWEGSYDETGNLISAVYNRTVVAGMKNGWFTLPVELVAFPTEFGSDARTDCYWEVAGCPSVRGTTGINGKNGVISITLPQQIGFDTLKLNFVLRGPQNNRLGEQNINIPLWVSYDTPRIDVVKRVWLKTAIEWAGGKGNKNDIAQSIMDSIHNSSGWKYTTNVPLWTKLIEDPAVDEANCFAITQVWDNLMKTLGVEGTSVVTYAGSTGNKEFLSKTGLVSFGGLVSQYGNAELLDAHEGNFDRWLFFSHTYGKIGGVFFDPTFNVMFNDQSFHVAADVISISNNVYNLGNNNYAFTINDNNFREEGGEWPHAYYLANVESTSPLNNFNIAEQGAAFTGTFTDNLIDLNGDGIGDQLGAVVGVNVTEAAGYSVIGHVFKNGEIITSHTYSADPTNWNVSIGAQAGQIDVQPLFSGEDILSSGFDGPYQVQMSIIDTAGIIVDSATFNTNSYISSAFGEFPTRITLLTESAQDNNSDGLFDEINASIVIETTLPGDYTLETALTIGNKTTTSDNHTVSLSLGSNSVNSLLPSGAITSNGSDGPYQLSVQIQDQNGTQTAFKEIETEAYQAIQFNPPLAYFGSSGSDAGMDIDGNGLFDSLSITLNVESEKEQSLFVRVWLNSSSNSSISTASFEGTLTEGTNLVKLVFPGVDINQSQYDGPYVIAYATLSDSVELISSANALYQTQAYTASQFEEAEAPLIISTGNYTESIIDANDNGLIDSLVIEIEVVPRDSGNVVVLGRLVDSQSETILWSSAVEFLQQGTPQLLHLKFDGRFIFGGLVDGPYYLRDLQIYHAGDPSQSVYEAEPFTTQLYSYQQFEPAAVITGTVKDSIGHLIPDVFLIVPDADNDFTNQNGEYKLVLLEDANYQVIIEGTDSTFTEWSIFVDGSLVTVDDSVLVTASVGNIVTVDFISPLIFTTMEDPDIDLLIPTEFTIHQNYPNPFNPTTLIKYKLPESGLVSIKVYDVIGNEVAELVNETIPAGNYEVEFNAEDYSSGVYIYQMKAGSYVETKKMVLMK